MPTRVLGVDLASGAWRDNGTALLEFDGERWTSLRTAVVPWPARGRPAADELAARLDAFARAEGITAISIDGPQGWRSPHAGPGWGRAADREARTPGKMGPPRTCVPGTYIGWVTLAVDLFDDLLRRPGVVLDSAPAAEVGDGYGLLECFPTSAWRTAGLTPLPAKAKTPDTAPWARALSTAFHLPRFDPVGHDDLQAVVAALTAAAAVGGPVRAVRRGQPAFVESGERLEGLIWDIEPLAGKSAVDVAPAVELPLLVVVTGPPGAGKTTVARALAAELRLPLIAKDDLKESLHDGLGGEGREWSRTLGSATFGVLFRVARRLLEAGSAVVVEGNFGDAGPFRELPDARIVQVHVTAEPDVLRRRFAEREPRHAVHYDAEVVDEIPARAAAGEWAALEVGGELLRVDTTRGLDLASVVDDVGRRAGLRR